MTDDPSPSSAGRTSGQWRASFRSADPVERDRAAQQVAQLGTTLAAALPALAQALADGDSARRARLATLLGDLGNRLIAGAAVLRDALRTSVLSTNDPELRSAASEALVRIGPYARGTVPSLVADLRDEVPAIRWSAANMLGSFGAEALEALPGLTAQALHDSVPRVRVEAAVALWRIDRRAARALPTLMEALKDPDEVVRWIAADCLGDMGPSATSALPALREAMKLPVKTRLISLGIASAVERIESGGS